MIKESKKKLKKQAIPKKTLKQVLKKRLMLSGLYVLLISPALLVSVQSIQLGVGIDQAFLILSIFILTVVFSLIVFLHKKYRDYSHPIWVISLGLVVTFVGFTLSGSFQEIVKNSQEKLKLQHRLYILIEESQAQKRGLERTILDLRTVLEQKNDDNEKNKFYVRKQLSVYNESDMKNSTTPDFEFVNLTHNKEIYNHIHIADMGSVSEIYNNLTFKSTDPEEMLQSYSELISLYYQVNERNSVLTAQYRYLLGEESSADINKRLKKSRKKNRDEALALIDDFEDLISRNYPKVSLKVDENSLLE